MNNKNQLLSIRLSLPEMRALKTQYEHKRKQITEHCPSVEPQAYRFSDFVREVLAERCDNGT